MGHKTVRITTEFYLLARFIGGGNVSKGIRKALATYELTPEQMENEKIITEFYLNAMNEKKDT